MSIPGKTTVIPEQKFPLLPLLKTRHEQLVSALKLIKCREKAALELQKQIKTAQEKFDATKLKAENLVSEYAGLDKRIAK